MGKKACESDQQEPEGKGRFECKKCGRRARKKGRICEPKKRS